MRKLVLFLAVVPLVGCVGDVGTGSSDGGRPSIIAACAEHFKKLQGNPKPVHNPRPDNTPTVIVNVPPQPQPEPSVRCSRDDHVGGAGATE